MAVALKIGRMIKIGSLLGLAGCSGMADRLSEWLPKTPKQLVARQVLVTLPESLKPEWNSISKNIATYYGLIPAGEFPLNSRGVNCLVYKVPDQQSVVDVVEDLNTDRRVLLAQENQVFAGIQTGESDRYAAVSYGPQLIHADQAHKLATGRGVKIAVIDTGADQNHPDLAGRIKTTANFVEDGERHFSLDRHGTAVAGVIGARINDGIGIYGVAPDAEIHVFKSCWYADTGQGKSKCSSWSLAKAIDAAIGQGMQIINLSLAGPRDLLLEKLLQTAHQRGMHIVAASLEKQAEPGFPAELPFVLASISAGPDRQIVNPTWLTMHTDTVVAPGMDILTTVPSGGYDFLSGSSLAAAHVSGIVALLLERDPKLSPDTVKKMLVAPNKPSQAIDVCAVLQKIPNGGQC